jgi:hypothetical protein
VSGKVASAKEYAREEEPAAGGAAAAAERHFAAAAAAALSAPCRLWMGFVPWFTCFR